MRLFIAVNFEYEVKQKLVEIQEKLKKNAVSGIFTAWENLHLTLVFFGEKSNDESARIKKAMSGINLPSFKISVGGLDRFRGKGGNTWWAGIGDSDNLVRLQNALVKELASEGIGFEEGRFFPHITLARQLVLKPGFVCGVLIDKTAGAVSNVSRISLMESTRNLGRLVYNEIYTRQLQGN